MTIENSTSTRQSGPIKLGIDAHAKRLFHPVFTGLPEPGKVGVQERGKAVDETPEPSPAGCSQ